MAFLEITIPPLPHYITSGLNAIPKGGQHPSRSNIQVFDLLITISGCFYIGEDDARFEVGSGQAVILRPDRYHFATQVCSEITHTYWLHFHVGGAWELINPAAVAPVSLEDPAPEEAAVEAFAVEPFTMRIPQFTTLQHPEKMYEIFDQLLQLQPRAHVSSVRFAQQQLFQEILHQLAASGETDHASASRACAEKAASYLRQHFRESVSAKQLGDELNFHPVYIARCMQKEYGCSPITYLLKLRVGHAKLLLLQTELPIAHIAQEVGFEQAAYFAASFTKLEGMSPRSYRQQFSQGI
ncbi:helix-turn-helix transcriptional regulator [Paenibacillus sp. Soil750]|uniref:helix-turn-helix transcriptional regulator n=1 Tax=Paenibacillus sp. Soil750 TaxID=1736398 RepID=UPI0006FDE489|nr:helix-turn-helix domain-containing protein [Paenibacillus sp. Soil750]KRE75332.1 AraC family transcriptional regulator [Paenibacillus sp. Soil750]